MTLNNQGTEMESSANGLKSERRLDERGLRCGFHGK